MTVWTTEAECGGRQSLPVQPSQLWSTGYLTTSSYSVQRCIMCTRWFHQSQLRDPCL